MDTKIIGSKIIKARKKANMSQAKLSQLLFISPQAVGKWERGESIPDIMTFIRLGEILGVDLNYFSENYKPADAEVASKTTTDNIGDIEQSVQEVGNLSRSPERQIRINLTAIDLQKGDFAGVTAHNAKFS